MSSLIQNPEIVTKHRLAIILRYSFVFMFNCSKNSLHPTLLVRFFIQASLSNQGTWSSLFSTLSPKKNIQSC